MSRKECFSIKVVDRESAKKYLRHVLRKWYKFGYRHRKLLLSLMLLLED